MEFKIRKKRKFEKAAEFMIRIKEMYKEIEVVLRKSQKEMQKYTDRKRSKLEEYRVED